MITHKTRKLACSDKHPSKPEESRITDDNASSDRSITRTLTYSSSDSNASNDSKVKNTKVILYLSDVTVMPTTLCVSSSLTIVIIVFYFCKTFDQNQALDKKKTNQEQYSGKGIIRISQKVQNYSVV